MSASTDEIGTSRTTDIEPKIVPVESGERSMHSSVPLQTGASGGAPHGSALSGTKVSSDAAIGESNSSATSAISAKPILKRKADPEEPADAMHLEEEERLGTQHMLEFEQRSQSDLIQFLKNKGVDASKLADFKIIVNPAAFHKKRQGEEKHRDSIQTLSNYMVTYVGPDNSTYLTKTEVYNAIVQGVTKAPKTTAPTASSGSSLQDSAEVSTTAALTAPAVTEQDRETVHAEQRARLAAVEGKLPIRIGNIEVLSLGTIDPRFEFYNPVQIYPVGYKCMQTIAGVAAVRGGDSVTVECEVKEVDGVPEFFITTKDTAAVVSALTEENAWKKFEPLATDKDWEPSFFNLEVELLLEGMEGVLILDDYRFHAHRGFGDLYTTEAGAREMKKQYWQKNMRERRNQQRQQARFSSAEELKRIDDLRKRHEKEAKDILKLVTAAEKEKKEREKEDAKKKKEQLKIKAKEDRSKSKQDEGAGKERQKQAKGKSDEKNRQAHRNTVRLDLKTRHQEYKEAVAEAFDREEAYFEEKIMTPSPTLAATFSSSSAKELDALIDSLIDCNSAFGLQSIGANVWTDILELSSCLDVYKTFLDLQLPSLSLESFIESLKKIHSGPVTTSAPAAATVFPANLDPDPSTLAFLGTADEMAIAKTDGAEKTADEAPSDANVDGPAEAVPMSTDLPSAEVAPPIPVKRKPGRPPLQRLVPVIEDPETAMLRRAEAVLDRVQLCLVRAISGPIHTLLDLDEKEHEEKRSRRTVAVKLPINQLTWPELARMSFLAFILQRKGGWIKEDIQCLLRGGKSSVQRVGKNVVRNIRYRLNARYKTQIARGGVVSTASTLTCERCDPEDALLSLAIFSTEKSTLSSIGPSILAMPFKNDSDDIVTNDYSEEQQLFADLQRMAADTSVSETYRRCCKIMLKIINLNPAKNLLWEIDSSIITDYLRIRRPIMLSTVVAKVVSQAYGDGPDVPAAFYADLRQVCLNVFSYHSEHKPVNAGAAKVIMAAYRHTLRWLAMEDRLPLEKCAETFCIMSGNPIKPNASIKCGRCLGIFCLDALHLAAESPFLVQPTQEIIDSNHEEWNCAYCIQEDSITALRAGLSLASFPRPTPNGSPLPAFYIDEMGPSVMIPWQFHDKHIVLDDFSADPPLQTVMEALEIVAYPLTSSVLNRNAVAPGTDKLHITTWSIISRIKVLLGMCELLKADGSVSKAVIEPLHKKCESLVLYAATTKSFSKNEFMRKVADIGGESLVEIGRAKLAQLESEIENNTVKKAEPGRCMFCQGAVDEDARTGRMTVNCDICGAKAHETCMSKPAATSPEWFCSSCADRKLVLTTTTNHDFNDIDKFRCKELEDELFNRSVDILVARDSSIKDKVSVDIEREMEQAKVKCQYCGMSEVELCSPFVIGQSSQELESHITGSMSAGANGVNEAVSTTSTGDHVKVPPVKMPYFPLVSSAHGESLLKEYAKLSEELSSESLAHAGLHSRVPAPTIVHQMCALLMFQKRMDRAKLSVRRKRKAIANQLALMTGIFKCPVGVDDRGREYWKFSMSPGLFISSGTTTSADKIALLKLLGKYSALDSVASTSESGTSPCSWRVVNDEAVVRNIVGLLGNSQNEIHLRQGLTDLLYDSNAFKALTVPKAADGVDEATEMKVDALQSEGGDESKPGEVDAAEDVGAATQRDSNSDGGDDADIAEADGVVSEMVTRSSAPPSDARASKPVADNTPVELRYRGIEIPPIVFIHAESIFEDGPSHDDDEAGGGPHVQYFTFTKKSQYMAVALVNKGGRVCKMGKNAVPVYVTIAREGVELSKVVCLPNPDNIYYFKALEYRRSGKYTITFSVEGDTLGTSMQDLTFEVNVQAYILRCGAADALERLQATKYLHIAGRRQLGPGVKKHDLLHRASDYSTEFAAVRSALLRVFVALPAGALVLASELPDMFGPDAEVTEAVGWSDALEEAWYSAVDNAKLPQELMECAILLEYTIAKPWITMPDARLLNALPSFHFAVRETTLSSVALRIYSLDRALLYDKVQQEPRSRRGNYVVVTEAVPSRGRSGFGTTAPSVAVPSSRSRRSVSYRETAESDEDADEEEAQEDDEDNYGGRRSSRRAAAAAAHSQIRKQSSEFSRGETYFERSSSYEDRDSGLIGERGEWTCPMCTTLNDPKSRSCISCDARKPAVSHDNRLRDLNSKSSRRAGGARSAGKKRRSRKYDDDDDEDEDEDEDEDDEDEDDDLDEEQVVRQSTRKKAKVNYDETAMENVQELPDPYADLEAPDFDGALQSILDASAGGDLTVSDDATIRCYSLLRLLWNNPRSKEFWYSLDGIPGYTDVIAVPMDLKLIFARLSEGHYNGDVDAFAADVGLVWSNCKKFNAKNSSYYRDAVALNSTFDAYLEKWVRAADRPADPNIFEEEEEEAEDEN